MSTIYSPDHVLPRPVETLPEYAHAKARQSLAEKLTEAFKHSVEAASAIANAVVDPSAVRKGLGEPTDPQVEFIAVPGGTLLGIRTDVWAPRIMPDPRNPRIGPARKHPFAVDPGTAGEDSRFRPVPEPKSPDGREDAPELVVEIESRDHLAWASTQAAKYVLAENNWSASIASQGVMEAVWLVPTTYLHGNSSSPAAALVSAEGSSRLTSVHDQLKIRSADVPYDNNDAKFRADIRKLNEAKERGADGDEQIALRCQRVPALIIVGFRPHAGTTTGFPTAIKSLVALRHVDPPKPWGEGPENEAMADEVLDEFYRKGIVSKAERAYLSGSSTKAEAIAAHLSDDPAIRAARIVEFFTSKDPQINSAIRLAVTSQSTRKRITPRLKNELATALILRALDADSERADRVRRYIRHAFGKAVHQHQWQATNRDVDTLAKESMREVMASIANGNTTEPGPASLELAIRSAYPLIVQGRLNADHSQPDRRSPGELLDAVRQTTRGIHQIVQALKDFKAGDPIRAVDENGQIKRLSDNSGDQTVTDVYLREEFPPRGKIIAKRNGITPTEILKAKLAAMSDSVESLRNAHASVIAVQSDDGRVLAEADGVDPQVCSDWRDFLRKIDDDLNVWGRKFRQKYAMSVPLPSVENDLDTPIGEPDEGDGDHAGYGEWDNGASDVTEAAQSDPA